MMPDVTGTQVAEELTEDPDTKSIPIIFVTAVITPQEIKERRGISGGRDVDCQAHQCQ
jgi:CheY-like chemotaxis protein